MLFSDGLHANDAQTVSVVSGHSEELVRDPSPAKSGHSFRDYTSSMKVIIKCACSLRFRVSSVTVACTDSPQR